MPPDHGLETPVPKPGMVRRAVTPVLEFLATEAGGGAILLAATVVALAWVNSPWGDSYEQLWHRELTLGLGEASLTHDLRHWVNAGLMTLFFFVVGLEIKRELVAGELASARAALLPVVAAVGGMVVPALIYLSLNAGGPGAHGWGIPMATDIAFAVGILSLLGFVSTSGRVFLLSLAIVDDIGAIVLIAAFYSVGVSWIALTAAVAIAGAIGALRWFDVRWLPLYVALGAGLWIATSTSGVHATIAGVILGLMTPARPGEDSDPSLRPVADRLLHRLHPWTSYAIVPLFALANAGVELSRSSLAGATTSRVAIGITAGLGVGKLVGVAGASWAAVRLGLRPPPEDGWAVTTGIAAIAGVGFTVSLFIADLAFGDPQIVAEAKIGILAGSALASILGASILRRAPRPAGRRA
jgi:NhaA family Na+:H+ antiporter